MFDSSSDITDEHPSTPPSPSPISSERLRKRLRILIIDDDPLVLRAHRRLLQHDHDVVCATGGQEGLDILEMDGHYDVILCDLMMPRVDGRHIFETLEAQNSQLLQKLLFLTGGAFTSRMTNFVEGLSTPPLAKPISRNSLLVAVEAVSLRIFE
jgi:CheY-like chemotaxis protein